MKSATIQSSEKKSEDNILFTVTATQLTTKEHDMVVFQDGKTVGFVVSCEQKTTHVNADNEYTILIKPFSDNHDIMAVGDRGSSIVIYEANKKA
jgi:hypothetical protein